MMKKDKRVNDVFFLSLGGATTVASFAQVAAIAPDRLRRNVAVAGRATRDRKWRAWIPRRFRIA